MYTPLPCPIPCPGAARGPPAAVGKRKDRIGRCGTRYANMHNILTNIGNPFGHQSDLDENSRRNSTTCLHGIVFLGYLVFSKIGKNNTY